LITFMIQQLRLRKAMVKMPKQCAKCGAEYAEVAVYPGGFSGNPTWVCSDCLPFEDIWNKLEEEDDG